MSNNPYKVKHKRQRLADFRNDIHRFSFEYNGTQTAACVGSVSVFFDNEDIPEDVKCDVQTKIYELIDRKEWDWVAPKGAQEIADAYCAEEFN